MTNQKSAADESYAENFKIDNYEQQSAFASFLPGIAGIHGIPLWCCYVNRGQCIAGFGADNKDGAIMEFYPAHTAYQNVNRIGFRTFLRKNGQYSEAFTSGGRTHMEIGMNTLSITDEREQEGLRIQVTYFILPEERLGALVRRVTVTNVSDEAAGIELLDGMPAIVPYGVEDDVLKSMTQTGKAWMQVEDVDVCRPYYRVRASIADSSSVQVIEAGNFALGFDEAGELLPAAADPGSIFAYDLSLSRAVSFAEEGLAGVLSTEQVLQNQFPCGFFGKEQVLQAGESLSVNELFGHAASKILVEDFAKGKNDTGNTGRKYDGVWFDRREHRAEELTAQLTGAMATRTGNPDFDAYCRYTYMDNVLRGGLPMKLGDNKVFYVYSRKHGDLERDYNYFSMLPEFYSQGNGNFRDVNQNRRCDVLFAPFVGRENIHQFYGLIQLDGYNPLGVEKITYQLPADKAAYLIDGAAYDTTFLEELKSAVAEPFTPGQLWKVLEKAPGGCDAELFRQIINFSESTVNGAFLEGYWTDHWTYNLDLIESYLSLYPEREKEMLFEEEYTWFLSQANIEHRFKRYEKTDKGLRQYHALNEKTLRGAKKTKKNSSDRGGTEKLVHTEYGEGSVLRSSLWEKLLVLCGTKFSALDPYGLGIEMEGGKPGWYDALNGLPGLFGSSMAESYELERLLQYCIGAAKNYPGSVSLLREAADFLDDLYEICRSERDAVLAADESAKDGGEVLSFWNRINDAKESYRDRTYRGISGSKVKRSTEDLLQILISMEEIVRCGIEKACRMTDGIAPTYFYYEVVSFEELEEGEGYRPLHFARRDVPLFLEGPVRCLKLNMPAEEKQKLYTAVKDSDLYDEPLHMYKICTSLLNASYELGRARAFTPGWLENESIWLHMEYKYLLELLKSGMYREFFEDFRKAAVPFLDPKVYGRSIYENSSFIASSANPDPRTHGKGFVARLSGSTIEFISMWHLLFFGPHLFTLREDQQDVSDLCFAPQPALPEYLIPESLEVEVCLLGSTKVVYQAAEKKDYIPGEYRIAGMHIVFKNGSAASVNGEAVSGRIACDIRDGKVESIRIQLQ